MAVRTKESKLRTEEKINETKGKTVASRKKKILFDDLFFNYLKIKIKKTNNTTNLILIKKHETILQLEYYKKNI
jgi:hypothetical protein